MGKRKRRKGELVSLSLSRERARASGERQKKTKTKKVSSSLLTDDVARRRDLLVHQEQAAPLVLGDHALRVGHEVGGDVAVQRFGCFFF